MDRGFVGTSLDDAPALLPGAHLVLLSRDPLASLESRRRSLEVRDTLLVLGPNGARFAFLFRVPCSEQTVAENVLRYGTGGLWIDGCRITYGKDQPTQEDWNSKGRGGHSSHFDQMRGGLREAYKGGMISVPTGRWPTNLVLIHGPACRLVREVWTCQDGCPVAALDRQSGEVGSASGWPGSGGRFGQNGVYSQAAGATTQNYGDSGGASRFFPQFAGESELIEWLGRLIGL